LGVAFFTLLERKILSYTQVRIGPNKATGGGLIQPLLDGLKLFLKQVVFPLQVSSLFFFFIPGLFFCL